MATYFQPRYSLRWLFIAVTLVAVLLVVGRWWWQRATKLEARARELEEQIFHYADYPWFPENAHYYQRAVAHGEAQVEHLRQAKWRPWMSTHTEPLLDLSAEPGFELIPGRNAASPE